MKKPFFISDLHFGHKNVIGFCDRPYADVDAMNDALINNWNKCIKLEDNIYIIGDLSFMSLDDTLQVLDTLKGVKHLVFGNHDHRYRKSVEFHKRFATVADYLELAVDDNGRNQHVVLCHYPILSWNRSRYGAWMLHGHTHGRINNKNIKRYDVGVDCNDYRPVHYDQIKTKFDGDKVENFDI